MSPKRQREEDEDDLYSSSDEIQQPSTHSKRRKSSETFPSNRTSIENANSDEAIVKKSPGTELEMGDDEEDAEDEEDEEEMQDRVREAKLKRRADHGDRPESGYIEHIELQDFMCHRHLEMKLGSKINFVIGHNGSGKSAVLSAIVVGLGAKAIVTNRASNLKSLIREGASSAQIKLRFSNRGPDAYKPEIYGPSITIERKITRDGSNGFKIKCLNKSVETKKDELHAIIDHFMIQADNPLTILTQDAAREFLSSSSDETKYKGTSLTQLCEDYSIISESINMTEAAITRNEQFLPELKQEAKEARNRFKDMQHALSLEGKMQDLKNEMAWSQVVDKEKDVEKQAENLRKCQEKMPEIEKRIAAENEQQAGIMAKIEELEADLNKTITSTKPLKERRTAITNEIKAKKERLSDFTNEEIEQNNAVIELRKRKADHERRIDDETRRLASSDRNQRTQDLTRIQNLETEVQAIEADLKLLNEEQIRIRTALDRLQARRSQCQSENENLKKEILETDSLLTDLKSQREDRVKAFGNAMPDILRAINAENRWKRKPVGPFGMHIKLKYLEWANLLESIIGNTLQSFLVETFEDQKILQAILARYKCPAAIYVLKHDIFEFHDIPDEKFQTILSVLEFDNEWIKRQLIISNVIHKIILVQHRLEAGKIMYPSYPRNVIACYTMDLFQVGHVSGMATKALNKYKGRPRFAADVEPQIRECEEKKRILEDQYRRLREELNTIQSEERELTRQGEGLKNRQLRMRKDISSKQAEITHLNDKLQEEEPANIAVWQEAIQDAERQIQQITKQFAQLAHDKAQLETEITRSLEMLRQADEQLQIAKSDIERINELIVTQQVNRAQIESNIKNWTVKKTEQQERIENNSEKLEEAQNALNEWTKQATEYCPERVEVTKSSQELDKEIKKIQTMLRAKEKEMGVKLDEIAREATRKVEAYKRAEKDINDLKQFVKLLIKSFKDRTIKYDDFLKYITLRAKAQFHFLLSLRGFTGKLGFDHKKGRLQVKVKSEEEMKMKSSRDKDPRSLSGGEKSFSTICLLLTLWESIKAPLICLDEFDVFMDAVNRRISMKMLIENASSSESQYIFITPQDASSMMPGADVRVHKLRDPERDQGTLNFTST